MAIITDPDLLTRSFVIFGAASQEISIYPIGDTPRGSNSIAVWVTNTSTIMANSAAWTGVVNGDVVCLMLGTEAGHYFVNNNISTSSVTLANVDSGTSGAAIGSLTVNDVTFAADTDVDGAANTITLTAHSYVTGDAVVYDTGAETEIGGLANTTVYYIIYEDTNTVKLASSYANAKAGTEIDITTDGTGTQTFHKRLIAGIWNNGAATSEQINGNPTSGDGDGDVADGVSLQAVYSFSKEEWRDDSLATTFTGDYNDDLIRHQIPLEAITSEQFEVGGGASHDDWNWFNSYTRKKIRTAGWAEKNTVSATNDLARETGIITLGSLDTDTQVYYQQTSATTNPADFTFLGAVNEAVRIYYDANQDGSPDNNYTTYLKLFARKKGKTYSQATISDIGVTTIQTIVNRFPLAHLDDTAIVATDGEILGTSPYRNAALNSSVTDAIDGDITTGGVSFTDADATFQTWNVVPGDTLRITNGNDIGYYTIASVDSETQLTIATDFEFSGWVDTSSSVTYSIYTNFLVANTPGDGTVSVLTTGDIADVNTSHGTITDAGMFGSVASGDILYITEAPYQGVFRVQSSNADSLVVETTDTPFGTATVDYMVLQDGMYLEYKNVLTDTHDSGSGAGTITYNDTDAGYGNRPTITLGGADVWTADTGSILVVSGSASNDGRYTVYNQETTKIVSLVPTDVLVDESDTTPTSTITHYEGFKRTIGTGTYAFNWKVKANGAGLDDIYQFIQHQLRQSTDIDYGGGTARGDITDLLMSYAAPTGVGLNTYFDNLDTNDINNVTLQDHSGANRTFPYTAAGSLTFNTTLTSDANAKYWLFFTNDDAGDNLGRDYGTKDAIIVKDADSVDIAGDVSAQASIPFTYDYDGNVQRGSGSSATNAPVTLVAIGLSTAQFVVSTGTISRATGITISAVAALERNYST
jgi:hypothetical protein